MAQKKLDQILESFVASPDEKAGNGKLLGAAFVVVNKDGVLYHGASGRIHSAVDSTGFSEGSCCWVASLTKIVTAAAAMLVVEDGLIGLDDDVKHLVPQLAEVKILRGFVGDDIPYLVDNTFPITLRQLLTHTAGFGYRSADPDLGRWAKHVGRNEEDLQDTVERWNNPLKFAPGQGWYYGVGLDWAGQVIEKLTNKTLGEFMTETFFKPLGMNDSTFRPGSLPHIQDRLVATTHRDAETGVLTSSDDHPSKTKVSVDGGGAGLYTTAADFAKFLQTLLKASAGEEAILKQDTVDEMFKPQLTSVQRHELKFLTELFHDGMVPDFETGMPLDHGIGGVINLEDSLAKRKKGSLMWAGMTNGHWFVDRQSGIGATFITNVLPHPDAVATRAWNELERAVYSDLISD
ncbi:hypothetical protein N0V82_008748 [Gnomoniopsis sp. IMI 355080]|nr:hypothetical protein N0V82_008748 [Gnomoniopsis sp. IMI 355080]